MVHYHTVKDKSFKGKSFTVCWVHQVNGEKFHDHLHTFMVFQLYKTAMSVSTKVSRSSHEFSLKLYSEMDESTLLTHVCADFHAFQDDHAVTGGEELQLK